MKIKQLGILIFAISISVLMVSNNAFASAFQLYEQSAALLGTGDAGTAVTDDPSVQYFNPAGMTQFKHTALSVSGILVAANIKFRPTKATNILGKSAGGGTDGPGTTSLVPAFYFIHPINDKFTFGFGVTTPFGLSTDYGELSMARYFATKSSIETVNLNPSIAFKINEAWSVGVGLDVQYAKAILNQAVDYKSIDLNAPGDIFIRNEADDWGLGGNLGIFYQPTSATRIGFSYRSQIHHSLKGDSTVVGLGKDLDVIEVAGLAGFRNSNVKTGITLPDYATVSIEHNMNKRWTVMADAEYTRWNEIKKVTLTFSGNPTNLPAGYGHLPPKTINFNYHNSWRFSVGQTYKVNSKLTAKMGLTFDETPVPKQFKDVRLPDSNRYWLALGANYKFSKRCSLDVGYAHIFFDRASTKQSSEYPIGTIQLNAKYRGFASLYGAQFNYYFS